MAREIYSYSKFTNVNGGSDVLSKLRTFALAQGWSVGYWHQNSIWSSDGDGTYSFAHAGSEDNLELRSNGYGLQNLVYRFRKSNNDALADWINMSMIDPNNDTINDTLSTAPYLQNRENWTSQVYCSMPASSFPEMCLIGNDKVIYVHNRYNSIFCPSWGFGTPELIPEEGAVEDEFNWYWIQNLTGTDWDQITSPALAASWFGPFSNFTRNYYMNGQSNLYEESFTTMFPNYLENWTDKWSQRQHLIMPNGFSGYRNIVSVPWFRENMSTGVFRCMGHSPIYYIPWAGLTWGELITRGSESYIVFPHLWTTSLYGVAWRVV